MDFQITPKFCWSRLKTSQLESVWGFYFIIDFSQGVYQEIHPYIAISIERVKINTSFHAMRKYLSYQSIEERGYHEKYYKCIAKSYWSMEISWKSIKMSGRVIVLLGELLKRYQEGGGGNLLHPCRGESSRRVVWISLDPYYLTILNHTQVYCPTTYQAKYCISYHIVKITVVWISLNPYLLTIHSTFPYKTILYYNLSCSITCPSGSYYIVPYKSYPLVNILTILHYIIVGTILYIDFCILILRKNHALSF